MKKLMVMAAVAVFGLTTIQAQDGIQFGVKAGVNFAKLTGDSVENADGRTGLHIGGVVEIPISEKFSVQPELLYSQQGLQAKDTFEGQEFESKFKLDYISIPVMAKFYVAEGFAIEAGPQIGILASAKFEQDGDKEDVKDFVKKSDISLGGGVSYKMQTGLFFQARYMIGISDVNDTNDENTFGTSLNNSVLSLSIGYMF